MLYKMKRPFSISYFILFLFLFNCFGIINSKKAFKSKHVDFAKILCNGGIFVNTLNKGDSSCIGKFRNQCDIEISIVNKKVDRRKLQEDLSRMKKNLESNDKIPACDKAKLAQLSRLLAKLKGIALDEEGIKTLGLESTVDNISKENSQANFCAIGKHIEKRFCCQFKDLDQAESFSVG